MIDISNSLVFVVDDENISNVLGDMIVHKLPNIRSKSFVDGSFLNDPEMTNLDLLVIDIKLKGSENGYALACLANKIRKTPVLFISGFEFCETSEENKQCLDQIEVYDFIMKPIPSELFTNRVRVLLSGMKYSCLIEKDRKSIENRFWALLRNMMGIYCIFSKHNGDILFADNQFIKDIGLENPDEITEINMEQITKVHETTGASPIKYTEGRQDFISKMYDINNKVVKIVKWFTWYINSDNNIFLTIGLPVLVDVNSTEDIFNYYKELINNDKMIIEMIKRSETGILMK